MGFSRAELARFRDATVPDLLGPDCKLLFVGINPGLWTAAVGAHFAHPGNRFYPALLKAGIVEHPIAAATGMTDADRTYLIERGVGITNLVRRATARADELSAGELRAGVAQLRQTVARTTVRVVAVAGITAYRIGFGQARAKPGRQPQDLGTAELWVVPNPSGLNAHATVDSLAAEYREVGRAAGVL